MQLSPKEQAVKLVNDMGISTHYLTNYTGGEDIPVYKNQYAKECAKIAVDLILQEIDWHSFETPTNDNYWWDVKLELEKLN